MDGSIAKDFCDLTQLTTLSLDGLMSSHKCSTFYTKIWNSYQIDKRVKGGIPNCLFDMPKLQHLHLSGNKLKDELPFDLVVSPSLIDLSISHNDLRGQIPVAIQMHPWVRYDVSYNKLTGQLIEQYPAPLNNATIKMEVNRLSGIIPKALQFTHSFLSMLSGNQFDCDVKHSNLPKADEDNEKYDCGPGSFNYAITGAAVLTLIILCFAVYFQFFYHAGTELIIPDQLSLALLFYSDLNTELFDQFLKDIRHTVIMITGIIVVCLLPIYLTLTQYYQTYTFDYAWTTSLAHLSGANASIVLFVVLIGFCFVATYLIYVAIIKSSSMLYDGPSPLIHIKSFRNTAYSLTVLIVNIAVMLVLNVLYVQYSTMLSVFYVRLMSVGFSMVKLF